MAIDDTTTIIETAPDGSETTFDITAERADEGTLAEEIVEALFDEGIDAEVKTEGDLDGDGVTDAVGLDTDGDGQVDMVAGDMDGDGKVDAVAVDTDGDGQLDAIVSDTDGDGVADTVAMDTDGDGQLDVIGVDTDGDGEIDAIGEDTDGDGTIDTVYEDQDGDGEFEAVLQDETGTEEAADSYAFQEEASEGYPTAEEISTNSVEFTVGADGFPITDDTAGEYSEEYVADASYDAASDPTFGGTDAGYSTADASDTAAEAEQQAHADAAREAQAQADEYVAQGDYAAAAEARGVAEEAAWQAGDQSMLGASDVQDMEQAAYKQEVAEEYRAQQAEHIAEGNYEAAREDALNAGYATADADYRAGGADHTGQADQDAYNLGNAVDSEKNAEYFADNAEWYAEQGNFDAAESSAAHADEYQAAADNYADQADPTSVGYDVDPFSEVETGGSYDAATAYDAGGYDMGGVDTGFDAGVDTTPVSYDAGLDDTTV
ncbi:MAG: hypothetical protein KF855_17590 [Acidobacteria bacterium]|nr:hypothetical protein [Acidobacteriota bacterium]